MGVSFWMIKESLFGDRGSVWREDCGKGRWGASPAAFHVALRGGGGGCVASCSSCPSSVWGMFVDKRRADVGSESLIMNGMIYVHDRKFKPNVFCY